MRGRGQPGPAAEGPRRTLQVDVRSQGSGKSPSVSPDRGSTPTSPYSVPQIAPLPSSTLCPICKTTELTSSPGQPNFNACTQCHSKVCNQCGFNPNPHLTQLQALVQCHPACVLLGSKDLGVARPSPCGSRSLCTKEQHPHGPCAVPHPNACCIPCFRPAPPFLSLRCARSQPTPTDKAVGR